MAKRDLASKKKLSTRAVLQDWSTFSKSLPHMSEDELKAALDHEVAHANRRAYVHRLHRKYNQVRYANEQAKYGLTGAPT